jgi:hypothetical protein
MTEFGPKSPSRKLQPDSVRLHSPLALTGAFIYMLREYFKLGLTNWEWKDNLTASDIFISSAYNKNTQVSNHKPGIYVDKGQTTYSKVVIGDRDQHQPAIRSKGLQHYYAICQSDITINCVSPRHGESATIGDEVQHFIIASQYIIAQTFTLRHISPVIGGGTIPFEHDEKMFSTSISTRVEFESRWATIPIAPVLTRLIATVDGDPNSINQMLMNLHTTGNANV